MAGQTQLTPGDGLYHSSSLSETVSPAFLRAAFSRSFFFFSLLLSVFLGCLICRAEHPRQGLICCTTRSHTESGLPLQDTWSMCGLCVKSTTTV